jgi:heat-inducible transcriptional repressor
MDLDARKRSVLRAIVRDYVETAEPVGSKRLVERYNLRVSSATIRNDMATLEDAGLIQQPHTSAGRIPSDLGYRFFVDELMEVPRLSEGSENLLRASHQRRLAEINEILHEVCGILSKITNYTAVALVPGLREAELRHIQVAKVDGRQVLIIMVTDAGHVVHHMVDAGESYTPQEIEVMSSVLRRRLVGMCIEDIEALDVQRLRAEAGMRGLLLEEALRVIRDNMVERSYRVYVDGTMHILRQPEFANIERLTRVLEALEHEQCLAAAMRDIIERKSQGVQAQIGREHTVDEDLSLVTAPYDTGRARGAVGLVGPTRMDYEQAYAAVAYAAAILELALNAVDKG